MSYPRLNVNKQEIVNQYLAGKNAPVLAKEYGIGSTSVYRILKANGIIPLQLISSRQRNKCGLFTPKQDKEIASLYSQEQSLIKVSKYFSCSIGAIKNALRREKVTINPAGNRFREFSDVEKKIIVSMWEKNKSQTEIANRLKTHQGTICRLLIKMGCTPKKKVPTRGTHGMWKGGVSITSGGYKLISLPPEHQFFNMTQSAGYVMEHRLVMAEYLGRSLLRHETVHHKNGKKLDNRIENLELHNGNHGVGVRCYCAICGSTKIIFE